MLIPWFSASVTEPTDAYVRLGQCVQAARAECALKLLTLGHFLGVSAEAVYQMERGLRRFPVERLFSDALLADVDAQRFADALIRAIADAWRVEDRDGIARQLRLLTVAVEKRMAKAAVVVLPERRRA